MLRRLRSEDGTVVVIALLCMALMIPFGLALLSIVDRQAHDSGRERTRDRGFNLADSVVTSAAFGFGRSSWPSSASLAPSNSGSTGTADTCSNASYGATLGAPTNAGSATARLQPNLNATYEDPAYNNATWQVNVCDDNPSAAAVWDEGQLNHWNYDQNGNERVWIRAQATVRGHTRVVAALARVAETPALSSRYGLITGRMNSELTNTVGTVLAGGLVGNLVSGLLGNDPLVAADPLSIGAPPMSGVTAVRCGALDGCLTGALGAAGSLPLVNSLINGGNLVQSTSPTATSAAYIAQLKQQAINSGTYVASTAGSSSSTNPPLCTIPAGSNSSTVVYIEQVGTTGTAGTVGGPGDQFCRLDVTSNPSYKALVIGSGRVVLRGNNTVNGGTFTGLVYALNQQRETLGDAALPTREVIRIDRGAHVRGGVAADGKSAQVGIYPPGLCTSLVVLGVDVGCSIGGLTSMLGVLNSYNPAIQADVSVMNAVKVYAGASIVPGTYQDVAGEVQ